MKLFLISQTQNTGYDTYSDAVVAAENIDIARNMYPGYDGNYYKFLIIDWNANYDENGDIEDYDTIAYKSDWCDNPESVNIKYLGEATEGIEQGIICASYHAG